MYLSQVSMRTKTAGQKLALYLLSYIDANRLGDSDLTTTVVAIQNHLHTIRTLYPQFNNVAVFDDLFQIQQDDLFVHVDNLKDLCNEMKLLH